MQYTWGYIKEATLAKMDIDKTDALAQGFVNRMHIFANEALTQICSAIKPKHTFATFDVMTKHDAWEYCTNKYGIYTSEKQPIVKPLDLSSVEKIFWNDYESIIKVNEPCRMPVDFITFNDDMPIITDKYDNTHEAHDTEFRYFGDNCLLFYVPGTYRIAYNARWFFFTSKTDNDELLDIPLDICDALPSYIASQLFKIDDEIKSQIYRNEFEMFISRIDDVNYKQTTTIKIDGGW